MDKGQKIYEFIKLCTNEDGLDYDNKENLYCIVVYVTRPLTGEQWVQFIYKSLRDFDEKFLEEVPTIDTKYGINFQVWEFD